MDLRRPHRDFGDELPGISVLVPTYGRTKLLSELIYSYSLQKYKGKSELIILNDRHDQNIIYNGDPTVRIINVKERYETMGHKRNHLVELAQYPLVTSWDDDDIYLPSRLNRGVRLMRVTYRASRENRSWILKDNNVLTYGFPGPPMLNMILEKDLIKELGGFPLTQLNQDVGLSRKLQPYIHEESDIFLPPSTIYRHLRATDRTYKRAADYPKQVGYDHEDAKKFITDSTDENIRKGIEPTGDVEITPKWDRDWMLFAETMWSELKKT